MDMLILMLGILFLGFVLYQFLYNPYIHLVVGSLMTDVVNFIKSILKKGK